jgi:Fe-S cluster assembly protein SufD
LSDALRADVSGVSLNDHGIHDATGLINSAFVTDGFVINVDDGAKIAKPVELQSLHDGGQVHVRNSVTVGEGAKVTVFDRHAGSECVLETAVTELKLRKGAEAIWVTDAGNRRCRHASVADERDAGRRRQADAVRRQSVRQGGAPGNQLRRAGRGADLTFRAINLIGDSALRHHAVARPSGAEHDSTETVRNVVTGKAQGVFQGQIRVDRIAQKTDAQMACNTLLLSDDAGFATKPELEIFADDVVCAHGATVAEIDHNHLFYLMARGISEKTARGLLIKAFVAEIVEELDDEPLVEALETRIDRWLEAHA